MAILNVGAGQVYSTVSSAAAAAHDGDTVLVQAGTYTNDFVVVRSNIVLKSVGGLAILAATSEPPNGKAILTADQSCTIDGFGFTGAVVSDNNGAGIRYEAGNLVVKNSVFWNNQDGLLANAVSNGTITIQNSEFSHNGAGDGYSHNIYVGAVAQLTITGSYFHDAVVGHEIKSRAYNTVITGNRIIDGAADDSYDIDLPNAGAATITNNVIEKGANAQNYTTIHYGGESAPYAGSSLAITGNTIVNDNAYGSLVNNQAGSTPVSLTGNQIWGYSANNIAAGTVTQANNTTLSARPTLDLSSRAPAVLPPAAAPVIAAVPANTTFQTWGRAGAVVASGHILSVGAGCQFTSLASALAASADGDTIQVRAGTYVNDGGAVNHKVIIEGVGGIAHFVQQNLLNAGTGILVLNTDATLENLEFSGAHNYSGHEGGVAIAAGNATIVNSRFDGNDIGIRALDNASETLSVYDTDAGPNGNFDKATHNVTVGAIGSFTMVNSYIHGSISGHEISDRAYNSDIEENRIIDGAGTVASFSIDLGVGGNHVIANNLIEKGHDATNGVSILVGGEGTPYANTHVQIIGNTLISDMVNPDHPYTFFITNVLDASLPVTADRNTFIGGVAGSAQLRGLTSTTDITGVAGSVALDTSSPVSAAAAPAAAIAAPGPDTLTIALTETRIDVDASFIVKVDGVAVGGGTVTADHSQAAQQFTYTGLWSTGAHTVTVTGLNFDWHQGPIANALYVHSVALDTASVTPDTTLNQWGATSSNTLNVATRNAGFDAAYYLAHNPDVAAAGIDPLQHYGLFGWHEGRDPNALFSTSFYLNQNPDVAAAGINPLLHYENQGWKEGRDPSITFSTTKFLAANPAAAAAGTDPLSYDLAHGGALPIAAAAYHAPLTGADPLIDPAYYAAQHPDIAATGVDAGINYHTIGWQQGFNPDAWFDTLYYLAKNPDVAAAHIDPLTHFETFGWKEGRDPSALFSVKAYDAANPGAATSGVDPLVSFLANNPGMTPSHSPYAQPEARLFDPTYYLAHNPDVAAAHVDPLLHYEVNGWREGRDPSAAFSTAKYETAYADVRAAGMDPLQHYATYGMAEGRTAFHV